MMIKMRTKSWTIWKMTMHTITIQKMMMTTMKTKLKVKNQSLLRSRWSSHEDGAHRMECAGSYRMVEHDGGYRMKPLIVWNFS